MNAKNPQVIPDLILSLLFLAIVAITLFRIDIHGSGYLTPDSEAYLELAQNLNSGYGPYTIGAEGKREYFIIWPLGYPLLISLISAVSGLNVFWASKVLNLLLIGGSFLLLRQLSYKYSFVLASVYGAYTLMEVYSFTWSEGAFLAGLLLLAYFINQVWLGKHVGRYSSLISVTCISLFLIRYIGAFSVGVPLLLALYLHHRHKHEESIKLFIATAVAIIFYCAYLYLNYVLAGSIVGTGRFDAETESIGAFMVMLSKGLLNEFLIIREYRPSNQPDYLLYVTALLQLLVLVYVSTQIRKHYNFWQELQSNSFSIICLSIAFLYLVAILTLRSLSHFDDLDYRLLSPFSLLTLIGLLYTFVCLPDKHQEIIRAKYVVFGFFVVSLLLNVPKKFMMSQLQLLF